MNKCMEMLHPRPFTYEVFLLFRPDQKGEAMCSYIEELGVGRELTIQAVSYDCNNTITNVSPSCVLWL